jgi:hypothetical protein
MDWVYGLWDCDWLSVNGGLTTMGQGGRSGAREVVVIARREREGRLSRFSPMVPLRGELRRWPHDGAQQRRLVVLRWGDDFNHEE